MSIAKTSKTPAGGHFNPDGTDHGAPTDAAPHAGDLGNVTAGKDGKVDIKLLLTEASLEAGAHTSVLGRAVIVHAGRDDLRSQPSGDAGARVARGVIASLAGDASTSTP